MNESILRFMLHVYSISFPDFQEFFSNKKFLSGKEIAIDWVRAEGICAADEKQKPETANIKTHTFAK